MNKRNIINLLLGLILLFLAVFLSINNLNPWSNDEIVLNNFQNKVNKNQKLRERGIKLQLDGVEEENKYIFTDNFYMVEEGFEALTANRKDLQSAEMTYYANKNRVDFTYYYTPNPDDLDITYSEHIMEINLVQYNYIGTELLQYFNKINNEFKTLNIDFVKPDYVIYYLVDDDNYLATHLESQFVMKFGVKLPNREIVEIQGSFASGIVKGAVDQPKKTVSGRYTSEYSLIEFFYQLKDGIAIDSGIDITTSQNDSTNTIVDNTNKILELNEELIEGAINNKLDRIKNLVSLGADMNYQNEYGITPLYEAARNGNIGVIKYLISIGANPNIEAIDGSTPLFGAIDGINGDYLDIVKILLNSGVEVDIKGNFDITPLWLACRNGNITIARLLLENGANPNLELENEDDSTPLSLAQEQQIEQLINLLVEYGAIK